MHPKRAPDGKTDDAESVGRRSRARNLFSGQIRRDGKHGCSGMDGIEKKGKSSFGGEMTGIWNGANQITKICL